MPFATFSSTNPFPACPLLRWFVLGWWLLGALVWAQPTVVTAPAPRTVVDEFGNLNLTVQATGTAPLSYQWKHNGRSIPGATESTLSFSNLSRFDGGYFTVEVTDGNGLKTRAISFVNVRVPRAALLELGLTLSVPATFTDPVAAAAGQYFTVALSGNGTVHAWGTASYGETTVPSGLSDVVAISVGSMHVLALKSDGTVRAWGRNNSGQTSVPVGLSNVVSIAAAGSTSLALKADGTVVGWGDNYSGRATPPAGLTGVVAISGYSHSLALREDGSVVGWGDNYAGQTTPPAGLSDVRAVCAISGRSLALKNDGSVVGWGTSTPALQVPAGLSGARIACGTFNASAVLRSDGSLAVWGSGTLLPLLGNPDLYNLSSISVSDPHAVLIYSADLPALTAQPESVTLTAGADHVLRVEATGQFLRYQWFRNEVALTGQTSPTLALPYVQAEQSGLYTVRITNAAGTLLSNAANLNVLPAPTLTTTPPSRNVVTAGTPFTLTIGSSEPNLSYAWRRNGVLLAAETGPSLSRLEASHRDSGTYIAEVRRPDGAFRRVVAFVNVVEPAKITGWGSNQYSQLTGPENQTGATALAAGAGYTAALLSTGRVVVWGGEDYTTQYIPQNLDQVVGLDGGFYRLLALRADGTVVGWGGGPVTTGSRVPAGLTNIVAVSTGYDHSLVLRMNGTVLAWDENPYLTAPSAAATPPADLAQVVAISAGYNFSMALKNDGTVRTWGSPTYGVLSIPAGAAGVVAIAAGGYHALALRADGTVVAWGDNSRGQTNVPARLTDVEEIACGIYHSLARKSDGTVVVWGSNEYLQSKAIPGLSGVVGIAGGDTHSVVLTRNPPPRAVFAAARTVVRKGQPLNLSLTTTGTPPFVYQWRKNGIPIADHNSSAWQKATADYDDAGYYTVDVTDAHGATRRSFAFVNVAGGQSVVTWGSGWVHTNPPTGLTNVVAISSGPRHSLALREDGTVAAWGDNFYGQRNVPSNLTDVVAIAAGNDFSLALKSNGTVVRWGASRTRTPHAVDIVAIAAGAESLALRADGTVMAVETQQRYPVPEDLGEVAALSVGPYEANGHYHVLALRADGTVRAWGRSEEGQTAVPPDLTGVRGVAAGANHSLALRADGSLVAWGDNSSGQTTLPTGLTSALGLSAGNKLSAAIRPDRTLAVWGSSNGGALQPPADLINVLAMQMDNEHGVALTEGNAPRFLTQPLSVSADSGATASLTVSVAGRPAPTLQWYKGDDPVSGATGATLSFSNLTPGNAGVFTVRATNLHGTVTSQPATLEVRSRPVITRWVYSTPHPVIEGDTVTLAYEATGTPAPTITWYRAGQIIPGAKSPTLVLSDVQLTDAVFYQVSLSNSLGTASASLTLVVHARLRITTPPQATTLTVGQTLQLGVTTAGPAGTTYQWYQDNHALSGQTASTLEIPSATSAHAGLYTVKATAGTQQVTSDPAEVRVLDALQAWRAQHFGGPDALGDAADHADPDGDGLANLLEFALGSHPGQSGDARSPEVTTQGGRLRMSFTRHRADLDYIVWASSDLRSWQEIARNPGAAGESVVVEDSGTVSSSRFLRLEVRKP